MSQDFTHQATNSLRQLHIRVGKADSSFVYFTLEANEGLAFYSTLDDSIDENHRDLLIRTTPEYYTPLKEELAHLAKKMPMEILSEDTIQDDLNEVN